MKDINHDLSVIDEYVRLATALSSVEGFLDPREGYLLCRLAAEGPGLGAIVEIGSYCGRSTAFLAAGSKSAGREKVIAIDHFHGSIEHQAGQYFASLVLAREGTTFHRFRANLERTQLWTMSNLFRRLRPTPPRAGRNPFVCSLSMATTRMK